MVLNLADELLAQHECARRAADPVQLRRAIQLRDLALLQASDAAATAQPSLQRRLGQAIARLSARFAQVRTSVGQS